MAVRKLLPVDAPAFQALRLRGLLECPEAFSSSHAEEAATPLEVISGRLAPRPDGAIFGYFVNAALTGMVGVGRESQQKLSHKAFVWGMYVAPEHRRNGAGRSLLEQALKYALQDLGVRTVNLGVNTRNRPAIALYEAMGFATYGTEPGFLMIDGVLHDEHLMSCHVQGGTDPGA
jgi:ribosomal protein S18 acetylase RimI-like enzyme